MEENVKVIDENTTNVPFQVEYVRPFDRSPDKDFHNRTESEKKMICYNRALKAKVKDKIDRLQNEVEEREKEVDKERKLRQEVESKLQSCLQDMYRNKEVNQELKECLPRANMSDPFKKVVNDESETDLSSIEEQIVLEEEDSKASSQPNMKQGHKEELNTQDVRDKKGKTIKNPKSSPKQSPESSPKSSRSPQNVGETHMNIERASTLPFSNTSSPLRGFYGHHIGASPYFPYTGGLLSGSYLGLSGNLGNPYMHSPSLSQPSALQRPLTSSALNFSLNGIGLSEPPFSQSVSVPTLAGAATLNTSADNPTTATTGATGGQSLNSSPDSGYGASANLSGYYKEYYPRPTSVLPDPPFLPSPSHRLHYGPGHSPGATAAGASLDPDQNKHIASLLNEIDSQRQEAKRLKNELRDKDAEVEMLKLTLKTKGLDLNCDLSIAQKAADLVEEVYTAQKKRDEATVTRMKIANEERNDILARLHQLETRLDSHRDEGWMERSDLDIQMNEDQMENEDVHLFLSRLDSQSSGDNDVTAFMKKVEEIRQKQREVTQEEMQVVMEQRDVALAKCRKLEEELLTYQKERDADGGMDKSIKAKLATVQQERDIAVAKSKQLDDEIQTLRICYSLHKSLAVENTNNKSSSNTIVSHQAKLKAMKQELQAAQKENSHLSSELRRTTIDKRQLEQALESVSLDKERLQRLADVLKRKLNKLADEPLEETQH